MWTMHSVPAGHTLTVSIVLGSGWARRIDDHSVGGPVSNAEPSVYGPYLAPHTFETSGAVSVSIAEADILGNVPSTDQAAMLDAIPEADQDDSSTVWNDAGVLKVSTAP